MSARSRLKACHACASSKRKCDKQLPECQRCINRDVDCVYPQPPKRRRRQPQLHSSDTASIAPNHRVDSEQRLGFGAWDSPADFDFDSILTSVVEQPLEDMSLSFLELPATQNVDNALFNKPGPDGSSQQPFDWFLRDDTWHLSHVDHNDSLACVSVVDLEPFIGAVEQELRSWVEKGYNGFLHHRLYDDGMPTSLQDAYTTAASYLASTPMVKRTILQIAEERCIKLIQQGHGSSADTSKEILEKLANVHAMFVYVYIRLFDGSVRMRSSAEKQIPVLRTHLGMLRETARQYRGEDILSQHSTLSWTNVDMEEEYQVCQEMWRLWILTESIRRSHFLIDTTLNTYEAMSRGWAECTGAMMLTARNGLWEAESSVKWFRQCCHKSPLLVPSLDPEPVISGHDAKEIDDFAKMMWTYVVGADRIQCWIDSS